MRVLIVGFVLLTSSFCSWMVSVHFGGMILFYQKLVANAHRTHHAPLSSLFCSGSKFYSRQGNTFVAPAWFTKLVQHAHPLALAHALSHSLTHALPPSLTHALTPHTDS